MEHSIFQGELIPSGTNAATMKVHSKEEPPDFWMRLTKVFMLGKKTAQQKGVFQVIIADGCLFYGNDALRRRGGCCICLLMASGLIAKRFSIWVADASEGEITYTTFSKRLKLAVFIILPRLVYTSHLCGQSNMDDRHGGHEKTIKDFLTLAVRLLSRLHVGKTNGQEICWKHSPPDWPEYLLGPWKNPTSAPKDNTDRLREKYEYLRSQVRNKKLNQEDLKAFEDFEQGKIDCVKSFMCYRALTDKINNIKDQLSDMQEPHLMLLEKNLKLATDQVSSLLSSIANTSRSQTAADTSSLSTLSRKRKTDSLISVQSKKPNIRRQKEIVPKPTQTASNEMPTKFVQIRCTLKSTAIESPLGYTAFPNQSLWPLVVLNNTLSNTCIDSSKCTTNFYHTEATAATNVQPSTLTSPIGIMYPLPDNSHEEPSRTVSPLIPTLSVDSGTWSQESNIKETVNELDQQKLSDNNVQDNLQILLDFENSQNNDFDPNIFPNCDDCLTNLDDDFLKYFDKDT